MLYFGQSGANLKQFATGLTRAFPRSDWLIALFRWVIHDWPNEVRLILFRVSLVKHKLSIYKLDSSSNRNLLVKPKPKQLPDYFQHSIENRSSVTKPLQTPHELLQHTRDNFGRRFAREMSRDQIRE